MESIYRKDDIPADLMEWFCPAEIGLEDSPREYIERLVGVFARVWEVLADDGTLWVNIGDSYNSSPDKRASRPFGAKQGTVRGSNGLRSISISDCKAKDLIGIPWMFAFAMRDAGWYLRQEIIWSKPNCMPESVTDRCTKSHEQIFLFSKRPRYYFDADAIKEESVYAVGDPARSFVGADKPLVPGQNYSNGRRNNRPTTAERMANGQPTRDGLAGAAACGSGGYGLDPNGKRNKRSVWEVATKPYKGAHFACFPEELITPCILAGCPAGGVVLDPFMGSGTTAITALQNGRRFVGCELNRSYVSLQKGRLGLFQMDTEWVDVL
jgi:DNA modification methylase